MSGFDFSNMQRMQQRLASKQHEFDIFIKNFLLKQALDAVGIAKENTPVDTGLLRAAWTVGDGVSAARGKWNPHKTKTDASGKTRKAPGMDYTEDTANSKAATLSSVTRQGNSLVVTVVNPVEYASFVEYGHMDRSRENWIEGQFMCTLAIDEVAKQMPQRFQAEFAVWAREMGL